MAGAPYVALVLIVAHLIARLINRCVEGDWRFNLAHPEWVLYHLIAVPGMGLGWLILVVLPEYIGADILKAGAR
jgi:hypothetical protein